VICTFNKILTTKKQIYCGNWQADSNIHFEMQTSSNSEDVLKEWKWELLPLDTNIYYKVKDSVWVEDVAQW
jgi:hypothetical protein